MNAVRFCIFPIGRREEEEEEDDASKRGVLQEHKEAKEHADMHAIASWS
jgi:hypothetical protein